MASRNYFVLTLEKQAPYLKKRTVEADSSSHAKAIVENSTAEVRVLKVVGPVEA